VQGLKLNDFNADMIEQLLEVDLDTPVAYFKMRPMELRLMYELVCGSSSKLDVISDVAKAVAFNNCYKEFDKMGWSQIRKLVLHQLVACPFEQNLKERLMAILNTQGSERKFTDPPNKDHLITQAQSLGATFPNWLNDIGEDDVDEGNAVVPARADPEGAKTG
jgi:hypothetical protein